MASICPRLVYWSKLRDAHHAYRFTLKRPPDDSSVSDGELSESTARQYATLGNIERVHDRYDVIAAGAGSLNIRQQLACDQIMHVFAEIRGVQRDATLKIIEEKHACERPSTPTRFLSDREVYGNSSSRSPSSHSKAWVVACPRNPRASERASERLGVGFTLTPRKPRQDMLRIPS